jgi:hypothetical protein
MKKIDVGQAVQILANVGVIAGIAFLVVEIDQNNEALTIQTRLVREGITRDSVVRRLDNMDLVRATTKARAGEALTDEENFLLNELNGAVLVDRLMIYQQVQDGLLPPTAIPVAAWRFTFHVQYPRMSESWEYYKEAYFPPSFIQWYEESVIEPGPP